MIVEQITKKNLVEAQQRILKTLGEKALLKLEEKKKMVAATIGKPLLENSYDMTDYEKASPAMKVAFDRIDKEFSNPPGHWARKSREARLKDPTFQKHLKDRGISHDDYLQGKSTKIDEAIKRMVAEVSDDTLKSYIGKAGDESKVARKMADYHRKDAPNNAKGYDQIADRREAGVKKAKVRLAYRKKS